MSQMHGLALSIVLMATAANLISRWIKEYKWIAWIGFLVTGKSDEKLKYIKIILPKSEAFLELMKLLVKNINEKTFWNPSFVFYS